MFDRPGAYSSEKFDAYKHPERFFQVIAGYVLMSNSELDLKTLIYRDGNFKYGTVQCGTNITYDSLLFGLLFNYFCNGNIQNVWFVK